MLCIFFGQEYEKDIAFFLIPVILNYVKLSAGEWELRMKEIFGKMSGLRGGDQGGAYTWFGVK